MIVSHAHRFIFLKTKKTGSSSAEYALADLCEGDDIITPASRDEEPERTGRRAQNYMLPWSKRSPVKVVRSFFTDTPERYVGFYNHMPAARARPLLGRGIWDSYYKFAVERNPWDRQVSLYYWRYPDPATRPSFSEFIENPRYVRKARNWRIYTINDQLAVDRIARYETLDHDLAAILAEIGIEARLTLPRLKSGTREGGPAYREYYTDRTREIVAGWYEKEIGVFGYSF